MFLFPDVNQVSSHNHTEVKTQSTGLDLPLLTQQTRRLLRTTIRFSKLSS